MSPLNKYIKTTKVSNTKRWQVTNITMNQFCWRHRLLLKTQSNQTPSGQTRNCPIRSTIRLHCPSLMSSLNNCSYGSRVSRGGELKHHLNHPPQFIDSTSSCVIQSILADAFQVKGSQRTELVCACMCMCMCVCKTEVEGGEVWIYVSHLQCPAAFTFFFIHNQCE